MATDKTKGFAEGEKNQLVTLSPSPGGAAKRAPDIPIHLFINGRNSFKEQAVQANIVDRIFHALFFMNVNRTE